LYTYIMVLESSQQHQCRLCNGAVLNMGDVLFISIAVILVIAMIDFPIWMLFDYLNIHF
jgi:hypothetical protein